MVTSEIWSDQRNGKMRNGPTEKWSDREMVRSEKWSDPRNGKRRNGPIEKWSGSDFMINDVCSWASVIISLLCEMCF